MATKYTRPDGGFKSVKSITDINTKTLQLAYPAARDIAKELDGYALEYIKQAKARIDELVVVAQHLRWENEKLKSEAEEARVGTEEAVQTIHKFLMGGDLENLRDYRKGEEIQAVENTATGGTAAGDNPAGDDAVGKDAAMNGMTGDDKAEDDPTGENPSWQ
ncbi:uncharacterized protein B0H64DRAFT_145608 [Chaetomium fimeti]|uniref:Uncharacterized protein n=1 Tax=Chaetomium fimeti TaxID=1854472 RepID=A0AAE0HFK5_9PEZI|nr:hypothetical protein B0H64DRAFT_145608 [Chaetomium fimeti]